jgi:hypothetical protein
MTFLNMLLTILSSQFPHEFPFSIPQNARHCCLFTLQQNFYKYKRFFIILVMMKKHALDSSTNLFETVFRHQQPFLLSILFWKLLKTFLWKSRSLWMVCHLTWFGVLKPTEMKGIMLLIVVSPCSWHCNQYNMTKYYGIKIIYLMLIPFNNSHIFRPTFLKEESYWVCSLLNAIMRDVSKCIMSFI